MARMVVGKGRKHRIERDPDWAPGRHVATFTIHDQYYEDEFGVLQEVDEALETAPNGGRKNSKTQHRVELGAGGSRVWYPRRNTPDEWLAITGIDYYRETPQPRWLKLVLPAPTWRTQGGTWTHASLQLQMKLEHTWRMTKTEFILQDATAPTRFRFEVTLEGLVLGADWALRNRAGAIVGRLVPPIAFDANETRIPATAVYADTHIEWEVFPPVDAVYPVTLDPTFVDGNGGDVTTSQDTYTEAGAADTNFGTAGTLNIGRAGASGDDRRMFFKFDLSSLTAGATVNSADLSLYNVWNDVNSKECKAYELRSGRSGWTEAGLTHNKYDGTNSWSTGGAEDTTNDRQSTALSTYNEASSTPAWVTASLNTTAVAGWFGGSNTNYGFMCRHTTFQDWDKDDIRSSDWGTAGERPYLTVDYTAGTTYNQACTATALALVPTVRRATTTTKSVTSSTTASVLRAVGAAKTVATATTAVILKSVATTKSVTASTTASVLKAVGKVASATITVTSSVLRSIATTKAVTATLTALVERITAATIEATIATTSTLVKQVGMIRSVTTSLTASVLKAVSRTISATLALVATLPRIITTLTTSLANRDAFPDATNPASTVSATTGPSHSPSTVSSDLSPE